MEDIELKNLWQSYDTKISNAALLNAQSWALNFRCFESIQQQKITSKLNALTRHNIAAVIIGIIWVLVLGILVWGNHFANPFFGISVSMILLFSLYAIVVYIKHIIMISQVDYDHTILDTQKKLTAIQASTFQSIRIIWIQMPFHTTWWWSISFVTSGIGFWLISFPITLLFTWLTLYIYRNLRAENMHKKWVRSLLMAGPELRNIIKSMAFLKEIEEFKKDLV